MANFRFVANFRFLTLTNGHLAVSQKALYSSQRENVLKPYSSYSFILHVVSIVYKKPLSVPLPTPQEAKEKAVELC